MQEELKVTTIEAAPGATVRKMRPGEHYSPYAKYAFGVVYVLEDGRRVETISHHRLQRDAKTELASLPKAPRWQTTATLKDGRLYMTSVAIGISALMDAQAAL